MFVAKNFIKVFKKPTDTILRGQKGLNKGSKMEPYRYFALISKTSDTIIDLVQDTKKPDISYLDNFIEAIEITSDTYFNLLQRGE